MTVDDLIGLVPWLFAGAALGAVYMHLIARTVAAIEPPAAYGAAAAWLILRVGLAATVLALAAQQGAGAVLAALLGFMLARTAAIRRASAE
jgi:hypothetical protein